MVRQRGFTLIELMVVVAIIAVLAIIAISSYKEQVHKSRRAGAYNEIAQVQMQLERWRAENPSYAMCTPTPCGSGLHPNTTALPLPTDTYYTIALSGGAATAYTLTATPKGAQVGDRCGTLSATCDATATPPVFCGTTKPSWAGANCN